MAPVFARLTSKFEKVLIWPKNKFLWKKISNKAEFHADFKYVEKVLKKCTQKSYKQNKFDEDG